MRPNQRMTRRATCAVLDAMDEGLLNPSDVVRAALAYMSEDEVADMARMNGLLPDDDSEE